MEKTRLVRFSKGQVLFSEGETSREMYILRSGRVRVLVSHGKKRLKVAELGPGALVGEMSFVSGIPRSATVVAQEPGMANLISADALHGEAMSLSEWAVSIAKVVAQRLRKTTALLGDFVPTDSTSTHVEGVVESSGDFRMVAREQRDGFRLHLSGPLTAENIDALKTRVRELRSRSRRPVILDFSEVMDLDKAALAYLAGLVKTAALARGEIGIQNVQLVRNKALAIRGIHEILARSSIPMRRMEAGEVLIRQGEIETKMYVVKSGRFQIYREVGDEEIALGQAESGDVLGEMALLKDGRRSASVRAQNPGAVYVIDTREFYHNVYNVPQWFMDVIRGLVGRLRKTNAVLAELVRRKAVDEGRWHSPLGLVVDGHEPGRIILQGQLVGDNVEYLRVIVNAMAGYDLPEVAVDLSRVTRLDGTALRFLLNLYLDLKTEGRTLRLLGPQSDVLVLFEKHGIELERSLPVPA